MSKNVLLQDPTHEYASRFIELFHRKYGYRAVCVFTDRRERLGKARDFPILRSACVAASYDALPSQFAHLAAHLRTHHDVVAVVPFSETTVLGAADMARRLGLSWSQPAVLRRFRDKFSLKEHLRLTQPHIRINASLVVESALQVLRARAAPQFAAFVLKPNDGFGNRAIGQFHRTTAADDIAAYLRRAGTTKIVMEEYVDGDEYFVNGQIDGQGNAIILGVFSYLRGPANGRANIDLETRRLNHKDPMFDRLARYARQVMQGTGLLRSPFHLEVKVDAGGPCLIEVGARLAGHGNAVLCGQLHGPQLDLFDLAAHYYCQESDYGPVPLDWTAYDRAAVRYVHGVAQRRERLLRLDGIDEVEALPEFHQWVCKPEPGARVEPTLDSLSMPWSMIVKAPTEAAADAAAAAVRRAIGWNRGLGRGARVLGGFLGMFRRGGTILRNRALRLVGPGGRRFADSRQFTLGGALASRAQRALADSADSLVRRMQIALSRPPRGQARQGHADAAQLACEQGVRDWARQYLARPHPLLGRKGPICPYVQRTMDQGGFLVKVRDDITGPGAWRLRKAVLEEAHAFVRDCPRDEPKTEYASLVIVFPRFCAAHLDLLDRVHDQLKTHFMEGDLMFSPFHPQCTKPALANPDFEVFQAPFAAFAIRHMDVRDIAFLGTNRRAFLRYHERFGALFDQGKVSDDFGHVRMFEAARRRFDLCVPALPAD